MTGRGGVKNLQHQKHQHPQDKHDHHINLNASRHRQHHSRNNTTSADANNTEISNANESWRAYFPSHVVAAWESNKGKPTEEEEDDEADPFATQNPVGERWTSPHKNKNDTQYWWQNSDSCLAVDNICRSSSNSWFYYSTSSSSYHQPTFELQYMPYSYRKGVYADVRVKLKVHSSSRVSWDSLINDGSKHCRMSSIPHHVVLQSVFNVSACWHYAPL